jgi:hypothetical protein
MDTIRNYITRFAQWVLRKELAESLKNYQRVERERQRAIDLHHAEVKRRFDDHERIAELENWITNKALLKNDEAQLLRFAVEYAGWTAEKRKANTGCVHPAMRWGIGGFL